jgi:transposase
MEPVCVAGIDVHKSMVAVVVGGAGIPESQYQRRKFGTSTAQIRLLREWLEQCGVVEAAMESTALYWRPVWLGLEGSLRLHLAQARSNPAPRGRKSDYRDALRIVRRLLAEDLTLSWVPPAEQRLWRVLARTRVQLIRDQVQARNRIECLLEEGQIKLSSVVSDLLGVSGRRILDALVSGESDPAQLAALADRRLRVSYDQLRDACDGRLLAAHRLLLGFFLQQIDQLENQIQQIDQQLAQAQHQHREAAARLCEVPGIDLHAARQILAEIGPEVAAFASPEQLASWAGVCPGRQESAEISYSNRCPKGNRHLKRILNQAAWAAIRTKGSYFQLRFQRWAHLGVQKAAWAVAHKLLRLIWKILRLGVRYQERGPLIMDPQAAKRLRLRHTRALRKLGFAVTLIPLTAQTESPA